MGSPFHHTYIVYTLSIVFMFGSVSGWIDSNIYSLSALISSSKIDETERKKIFTQSDRTCHVVIDQPVHYFRAFCLIRQFYSNSFRFFDFSMGLRFFVYRIRSGYAMPCHAKFAHKLKHQIDMDIHIDLYWTAVPFPLFLKSCIINTKHKLTTITRISYGWLFLKSTTFKCSFHVEHLIENSEREKTIRRIEFLMVICNNLSFCFWFAFNWIYSTAIQSKAIKYYNF